jgi:hypothetical protein
MSSGGLNSWGTMDQRSVVVRYELEYVQVSQGGHSSIQMGRRLNR